MNADNDSGLYSLRPIINSHYHQAERWLSGRKTSLRTLDALHLACCWSMEAEIITYDLVLQQSAEFRPKKAKTDLDAFLSTPIIVEHFVMPDREGRNVRL